MSDKLIRFIDRLFGSDGRPTESVDPTLVARVHSELFQGTDEGQMSIRNLAAMLDGNLDEEERAEIEKSLVNSPQALHDLTSASEFLRAVEAEPTSAPTDVVEKFRDSRPSSPIIHQRRRVALWGWSIAAAAFTVLAFVFLFHHTGPSSSSSTPMIAAPTESKKDDTQMVPAGNETTVPGKPDTEKPRLAPEGLEALPKGH